jgi:hypothetical protein
VAAIDGEIAANEGTFLAALADAAVAGYKRDARALVEEHMFQLRAVVRRLRLKTGSGPIWETSILTGLKIHWYEDEVIFDSPHHQPRREIALLWPQADHHSPGAQPRHDGLVSELIAGLRNAGGLPPDAQMALNETVDGQVSDTAPAET